MKKIEAIIRPFMLEVVKDALVELGIDGMTVTEVTGFGSHGRRPETYRGGANGSAIVSRIKLEIVVPSERLARLVIEAIEECGRTMPRGDGRIFVTEILEAIRIRTGDWGEAAI